MVVKRKTKKQAQENGIEPHFSVGELVSPAKPPSKKRLLLACALLAAALMLLGYNLHWQPKIVGAGVILLAITSNTFTWLIASVGLMPLIGPLLAKILALPLVWLLNGVGYLVSFFAVRRGGTASRDVLISRGLTIALIVGIVIGYIIGKLV